jgi:RNA polymerase sigma factor (sigma-70 family)
MTFATLKAKTPPRRSTAVQDAFLKNQTALKRFISRFFRNVQDVEDVAQEAFLRAYSAENGRDIEQPRAFLFRIAKHIALNQLSRKSRQITDYLEDLNSPDVLLGEGSVEEEFAARQTLGLHCEAVATLPPHCRRVYMMRKVHGMSHKEIAGHLGIAVSTVEKHLIKGIAECDRYIRERNEPHRRPQIRAPQARGSGGRRRCVAIGAVFLLAVAVSLGSWLLHQRISATNGLYATALGEQRTWTLVDGSIIQLNTGSRVQVDYGGELRTVRLLRGEAYFAVAHDAQHPFEVHAGVDMIRAVGTAFSVYLKDDQVRVTVSEGRVALASFGKDAEPIDSHAAAKVGTRMGSRNPSAKFLRSLDSGQSATLDETAAEVHFLDEKSLERQTAWREGLLVFSGQPLSEVIAEVSRYTSMNIEIVDPRLRSLPVGGRFEIDDLPAILDVLESNFNIRVVRPDEQHIRLLAPTT